MSLSYQNGFEVMALQTAIVMPDFNRWYGKSAATTLKTPGRQKPPALFRQRTVSPDNNLPSEGKDYAAIIVGASISIRLRQSG